MFIRNSQASELRRFRRIPIEADARIIINGIDEYAGKVINISPGDLAVRSDARTVTGDAAVVYVAGLDVVEGRVARLFPDGFALSFILSRRRRAVLTEQLMLRSNPTFGQDLTDRRATPRHTLGDQRMVCRLENGASLFVRAIDQSVDAISVEAPRKPPVGSPIHIGRQRGVVVRHTPRGFVVVYDQSFVNAPARLRAV